MKTLIWNLVVALAWCAITGELSPRNLLLGLAIGYLALRVPPTSKLGTSYYIKLRQLFEFALFFAREMIRSTAQVAYDVLTPKHNMQPAVLAIPLEARTDVEITLLATLISLTPGSITLDVSPDRHTLYAHFMFVDDPDATIAQVKDGFERRVLELLR